MIHLATVPAGLAPGRLWVRVCTADELLTEHGLEWGDLEGELDGRLARDHADRGERVWCYVYDGDSGECVATLIVAL